MTLKPGPNDHNISTQHITTLLAQHLHAPAKRSQHFNITLSKHCWVQHVVCIWPPCSNILGIENQTTVQLRYIRTAHTRIIRAYFAYTRMSIRAHTHVYTRVYVPLLCIPISFFI